METASGGMSGPSWHRAAWALSLDVRGASGDALSYDTAVDTGKSRVSPPSISAPKRTLGVVL